MSFNPFHIISHAFTKAGETVKSGVNSAVSTISSGVSNATHLVTSGVGQAISGAETGFSAANQEINAIVHSSEDVILKALAGKKVAEYANLLDSLVEAWGAAVVALPNAIPELIAAAEQKQVNDSVKETLKSLVNTPALQDVLAEAAHKSFVSFGVEFGGNVAAVLSLDGSIGYAMGLPNITDVKGYVAAGLSIGASLGADGDVALSLSMAAPENVGGPFVAITVEGDMAAGGGAVVSFNLPSLSFGGITVNGSAGEEVEVAVGGGYTYVFD